MRRGTVTKVELVLEFRAPARIVVWAELAQEAGLTVLPQPSGEGRAARSDRAFELAMRRLQC